MSGAVVVRQKRLMRRFQDAKATNPETAVTLADLGCRDSWIFRRMVARGVFVEAEAGRFYIDQDAARQFVKRRRRVALIFLTVVILSFVIFQMFM